MRQSHHTAYTDTHRQQKTNYFGVISMVNAKKTAKKPIKTTKKESGAKTTRSRKTTAKAKAPAKAKPKTETKSEAPAKALDSLESKVEKLKEEAKRKGLLDNLLFEELLDEFTYQTNLLKRLRAEIDGGELTTAKTYVKGAPNISPNKLIATYNATSNARVNTVSALAKVVKSFDNTENEEQDALMQIIKGGGA